MLDFATLELVLRACCVLTIEATLAVPAVTLQGYATLSA